MTADASDPDMAAAELALGLLEGDERAIALRRLLADPAFAREFDGWRDRLAGLFDGYRPVTAPEALLDRLGEPARAPARGRWAWPLVGLAVALAAAVAFFLILPPSSLPTQPPVSQSHTMMLAALMPADKVAAPVSAVVDMDGGEVRVAATAMAPVGKTAQLWMIKDGVPHSLGLLHRGAPTRLSLAKDQRAAMAPGMTLAVSIEPAGGSPMATPTGPVVASGALSAA